MKRILTNVDLASNTTQQVAFSGRVLQLKILWNEPSGAFFMDISDGLGGSIQGLRLVENFPILANNKAFIDFSGDVLVLREDSSSEEVITYSNFGVSWVPYLVTAEELEAWRLSNGLG
jgi:hypothetical protein